MLKRIGAEEGGEFKAVASGTLPSGRPVVVNADGTVSVVSGSDASVGSATVFESASTGVTASTFDSSNNRIVISYRDGGNSNYATIVAGTVSGSSISFGTPVVFRSATVDNEAIITFDSNSNKVIAGYSHNSLGKCKVLTVDPSDNSISVGSEATFDTQQGTKLGMTFDSNSNKVVVVYTGANNYVESKVGTVSGTSISFGTAVVAKSSSTDGNAITFDSNRNKIVIVSRISTNAQAMVGTVSGTSISFASSVALGTQTKHLALTFDSSNNKVITAFVDGSDADQGKVIVGDIDGSGVISFGTAVQYNAEIEEQQGVAFDSNLNKVIIAYDSKGTSKGQVISGTVSGTSITFDSETVFEAANVEGVSVAFDSNANKSVISYIDAGNSNYGTSAVFAPPSTTLTSENYIGMSRGVAVQTGEAGSTGTAVSFESGLTELSHAAFDSSNNKVVIAYVDGDDTNKGKAVVATVSGTSISFGSIVTYEAGNTSNIDCVFDNSNNKIVILFQDNGDSGRGKGIVGTVSGTSISFGSATQFNGTGADNAYNVAAAFDSSNNKVVVAYRDGGNNNYGTAAVGTVSGTSISFGTPVVYESANSQQNAVVFDSSNNKVVIGYKDGGNSDHGTAIVGTVSGTSISFGSAVVFNAGETSQLVGTFDSSNNKVVLAYRDNGNSDQGTAIVGTVSGTSISFGSEVIFNAANTQGTSAVFDSNVNKVVISYEDRGDSDIGKFIVGTVSGTSISFDTETAFSGSNAVAQTGAAFDSNANKVVIAYMNDTDSGNRGEGIVTNLSTIATTRGEVADGGNASVDVIGSVSDNQIGLTAGQQYFVQTDGTISTTAGSPSVLAGTAISATELVVKT